VSKHVRYAMRRQAGKKRVSNFSIHHTLSSNGQPASKLSMMPARRATALTTGSCTTQMPAATSNAGEAPASSVHSQMTRWLLCARMRAPVFNQTG
jgi:hypothetical protein